MKILFVVSNIYLSEPLGSMLLMALCRQRGHQVRFLDLRRHDLVRSVQEWRPNVIAYSAMTPDIPLMQRHDERLKKLLPHSLRPTRIMGGAHPTHNPSVIDQFGLDAICQGEGDRAMPAFLERLAAGQPCEDIPNIALSGQGAGKKELITDLDALPFVERQAFFDVAPYYRKIGLRSFVASRGCPYDCSHCFNHSFNRLFRGCGPIVRRRSVESLLAEIDFVVRSYPPVRLIRFADDTFTHSADAWLEEFSQKYASRVGIPFYCLMRPNALTDDTARLLAQAGCFSIAMSVETGVEQVRRDILKRNLSDEAMATSFAIARKHKLNVFANTMIAIPGTGVADDLQSLRFLRQMAPEAPAFSICCPYNGTDLWAQAVAGRMLDEATPVYSSFTDLSVLTCYSRQEKQLQKKIVSLGALYCTGPRWLSRLFLLLIQSRWGLGFLCRLGRLYEYFRIAMKIFPQVMPRSPMAFIQLFRDTVRSDKNG